MGESLIYTGLASLYGAGEPSRVELCPCCALPSMWLRHDHFSCEKKLPQQALESHLEKYQALHIENSGPHGYVGTSAENSCHSDHSKHMTYNDILW